jgi:general secretion pathway protein D
MRFTPLRLIALLLVASLVPAKLAAASALRHQLDATLPEVKFDGVSLADAIDFLRDVSGANIDVNWKALEGDGVSKDTTINVKLRSISLHRALDIVLGETGGTGKIGFTYDQNVIEITTQELIDTKMYTRIYPVQDLIMEVPDFTNAPDFNLQSTSTTGSGGANGASGGGSNGGSTGLFNGGGSNSNNATPTKTPTERANDLMELIRSTVQPDVWQENGGKASIHFFNGNLIITAPRSVLEAIGGPFD